MGVCWQRKALEVTHLGGLLPRVDGSSFLVPAVDLFSVVWFTIMAFGPRGMSCSNLVMRLGDDMSGLVLPQVEEVAGQQLCWRRRRGGSICDFR